MLKNANMASDDDDNDDSGIILDQDPPPSPSSSFEFCRHLKPLAAEFVRKSKIRFGTSHGLDTSSYYTSASTKTASIFGRYVQRPSAVLAHLHDISRGPVAVAASPSHVKIVKTSFVSSHVTASAAAHNVRIAILRYIAMDMHPTSSTWPFTGCGFCTDVFASVALTQWAPASISATATAASTKPVFPSELEPFLDALHREFANSWTVVCYQSLRQQGSRFGIGVHPRLSLILGAIGMLPGGPTDLGHHIEGIVAGIGSHAEAWNVQRQWYDLERKHRTEPTRAMEQLMASAEPADEGRRRHYSFHVRSENTSSSDVVAATAAITIPVV
jgi:hypothetical protein